MVSRQSGVIRVMPGIGSSRTNGLPDWTGPVRGRAVGMLMVGRQMVVLVMRAGHVRRRRCPRMLRFVSTIHHGRHCSALADQRETNQERNTSAQAKAQLR